MQMFSMKVMITAEAMLQGERGFLVIGYIHMCEQNQKIEMGFSRADFSQSCDHSSISSSCMPPPPSQVVGGKVRPLKTGPSPSVPEVIIHGSITYLSMCGTKSPMSIRPSCLSWEYSGI
jgi:hypothetical protein